MSRSSFIQFDSDGIQPKQALIVMVCKKHIQQFTIPGQNSHYAKVAAF